LTTYFVNDDGSATDPFDTWAKAATSINTLDAAKTLASGDIVYFGHDHNCAAVNGASLTITCPASGLPVIFISATTGSSPPTYQKGTGTQIDTTENTAYDIILDGSIALYGIHVKAGRDISFTADSNEQAFSEDCTLSVGNGGAIHFVGGGRQFHKKVVVDLRDSAGASGYAFIMRNACLAEINGVSFSGTTAGEQRTGAIIGGEGVNGGMYLIDGADFSGFTNATSCELVDLSSVSLLGQAVFTNCKTKSGVVMSAAAPGPNSTAIFTNVGPADEPTALTLVDAYGTLASSAAVTRTGGGQIEGVGFAWLITTTAGCGEGAPFQTPWIYGLLSATGSTTFDVYITNDTADFTDAQVWIEVEYLATSDSAMWTRVDDHRVITTTAVDQADDTTSTWAGGAAGFDTFKQKLSVTATVGETGQFRARVCVGLASIASTRDFYIDPAVFVGGVLASNGVLIPGAGIYASAAAAGGGSANLMHGKMA
jgi:hypothetical protein